MTPPARVRDDLVELDSYESPQLGVQTRLNNNESPLPPPKGWRDALAREIAALPFHRYPPREANALRSAIAEIHGVPPEAVYCGNGSNEVLLALLLCYGGSGRRALSFEPTYPLHSRFSRLTATEVVTGERQDDFTIDAAHAERRIAETAPDVIFLCSPNNPTGVQEPSDTIERVVNGAQGLVIVDEAYAEFASESSLERVTESGSVVVVRTFSKAWSLAGLRLGYVIAPSDMVEKLHLLALPYHLDVLKQTAGRLALQFGPEMRARIAEIVGEREKISAGLSQLDVKVWPSSANFVLFRPNGRDAQEVWQALVDRSVLIRSYARSPGLENCLRVTVGSPAENDRFLAELKEVLA